MLALGPILGTLVVDLPVLAAVITGLVLLSPSRGRLPARSGALARAGLWLLVAHAVAGLLWAGSVPRLVSGEPYRGLHTFSLLSAGVTVVLALVLAASVGLLVAALATARDPGPPAQAVPQSGPVVWNSTGEAPGVGPPQDPWSDAAG